MTAADAWSDYPPTYRQAEVAAILRAVCAGECVALIGLSGSGKSNLAGFLAQRVEPPAGCPRFVAVDCNRLAVRADAAPVEAFYRLVRQRLEALSSQRSSANDALNPQRASANDALGSQRASANDALSSQRASANDADPLAALESALAAQLSAGGRLCLLLDRFDVLYPPAASGDASSYQAIANGLRALRDAFKYRLTLLIIARRPPPPDNELAELFFGNTIWLGPLSAADALWSARRDARRYSGAQFSHSHPLGRLEATSAGRPEDTPGGARRDWSEPVLERLIALSGGYPALLRAACEAYALGAPLGAALREHPAVQRRLADFWADGPPDAALAASGLDGLPWLDRPPAAAPSAAGEAAAASAVEELSAGLTASEFRLLDYLQRHAGQVCAKDDLVRAVWPDDVIYRRGIRDDSLAQLVRRLRLKIEPDPAEPQHIRTVPGRGYLYREPS